MVTPFDFSRLGNLVQLLDQLVLGHLVMIARDSVMRFVYETMRMSPNSSREALFEVKLIFPESGLTCDLLMLLLRLLQSNKGNSLQFVQLCLFASHLKVISN